MTRYLARLLAALAGAAVIAGSPAAVAQVVAPSQTQTGGSGILKSGVKQEEIIVTAQRRATRLSRTPVAVTALTSASLAKQAVHTERDLQSSVAGLTVRASTTENTLNYAIRGQSVDVFSNSRPGVQPYLDEVAVPQNGGSTAFYDLQSVQVLKGPQGTLFGRNSTGGAVLVTTAQPSPTFGGYLTSRVGDYGLVSTEGAVNIPVISDKIDLRVAGYYENRNGFQTNVYDNSHPGTVLRDAVRGSLFTAITDDLHNTIVVDYDHGGGSNAYVPYGAYAPGSTNGGITLNSEISTLFSPQLGAAIGLPEAWNIYLAAHPGIFPGGLVAFEALQKQRGNYTVDFDSRDSHEADDLLISDVLTYDLGADLQFKNIVGYAHSRSDDYTDIDGTPYEVEAGKAFNEATEVTEEAQLIGKALAQKLSYVGGFYFATEHDVPRSLGIIANLLPLIPPTIEPAYAKTDNTSYAGYFQGTYDLSGLSGVSGLGFTGGVRYTGELITAQQTQGSIFYDLPSGSASLKKSYEKLSWTVGMQEQLDPSLLLYVVSRHSFRSGGFNVQSPPSVLSSADGGALFYPEVATDVEVGAKYNGKLGEIPLRADIAVYNEWVNDAQREAIVPLSTGLAALTANVPQAEVTGIEVDGQISPLPWLNLGGAGAATDARFTQPRTSLAGASAVFGPYADTPKFSASVFAETVFTLPSNVGTVSVRADEFAQSSFYFGSLNNTINPGTKIPGYAITNFRVGLDNIEGTRLSFAAYVRNAFDKQYFVGGFPEGDALSVNGGIPGLPRMFYFEASYKF